VRTNHETTMLRFRPTVLFALVLALFFLPLVDSFAFSPSHHVAVRQRQQQRTGYLRLESTAAENEIEQVPKVGAKKDKITKEAQELLDVFAARTGGEAKHDLIVAQVAPSVR
jgi:Tfp pilus assembly protein PilN